jgi:hypothetical protein
VRPAVEGAGEEKIDLPGVGLSRTGFVGSVCGSLPPGRRPLRVRGRERGREGEGKQWECGMTLKWSNVYRVTESLTATIMCRTPAQIARVVW